MLYLIFSIYMEYVDILHVLVKLLIGFLSRSTLTEWERF